MQFGMLRHLGLDEQRRLIRVDPGRQPVDHHVPSTTVRYLRAVVLRGQGVPVGNEKQAGIFMLKLDPVLQHAMVMTKMKRPGGAHAGKDTFCVHRN
jgi:hypothetical protein